MKIVLKKCHIFVRLRKTIPEFKDDKGVSIGIFQRSGDAVRTNRNARIHHIAQGRGAMIGDPQCVDREVLRDQILDQFDILGVVHMMVAVQVEGHDFDPIALRRVLRHLDPLPFFLDGQRLVVPVGIPLLRSGQGGRFQC